MRKKFLIWLGLSFLQFIFAISVHGQNSEATKQKVFMKIFEAERLYDMEDYQKALKTLNEAKTLLDTTNTQIEYWRAKTYIKTDSFDRALESSNYYLENEAVTESIEYKEISKIKDAALRGFENQAIQDSLDALAKQRKIEDNYWLEIRRQNTIEAYNEYLQKYPEGRYVKLANNKIKNIKVVTLPGSKLVDAVKRGDIVRVREMVLVDSVDVNHQVLRKKTKELMQGVVYEIYHETPLYMAIYKMDFPMIRFLLEQGADPNGISYSEIYTYNEDVYKRSYLSSLIRLSSENGIHNNKEDRVVELIRLMKEYGLDPNYVNGEPLPLAVFYRRKGYRRTSVIRELLRMGADPKTDGLRYKGEYYSAMDLAKLRDDDYLKDMLKDKRYKKYR